MTGLTAEDIQYMSIFHPADLRARIAAAENDTRFVHYTSAEVAAKIIRDKRIWMRNAMTMNEFSEIQYGLDRLIPLYAAESHGGRLKAFFDELQPGFSAELERRFNGWIHHFRQETFLTSLSEHDASEDHYGRLSMWRAYGGRNGVAFVINRHVFEHGSTDLKAYSSSVEYLSQKTLRKALAQSLITS